MQAEDYYRQLFNASHLAELREFEAVDANSKLEFIKG